MEFFELSSLSIFLVLRSFLSIYIANVNGRIVKGIINIDQKEFIKRIFNLALCAIPASFVNSYLDYSQKSLAIRFRNRLTEYF